MSRRRKKTEGPRRGATRGRARATAPSPASTRRRRRRGPVVVLLALGMMALVLYAGRDVLRSAPEAVLVQDRDQLASHLLASIDEHVARVRQAPRSAEAHGALGLVYEANGFWTEAAQCYAIVERLAPDEPAWAYHRATAMREAGDIQGALELLGQLSKDNPNFPAVQQRFGQSLLEAGDLQGAAQAFRRVIALSPDSSLGYVGLGDVRIRSKEYEEAKRLLEKAISIDPGYKAAHYTLGLAYRGLGEDEAAKRELAEGLGGKRRIMPDPLTDRLREQHSAILSIQLRVSRRYQVEGRLDKAAAVLEALLDTFPDSTAVLNNLASVYVTGDQPAKAMPLLLRANKLGDATLATYVNLAACCLQLGRLPEALGYAQQAVQVSPNDGRGYLAKANVLIISGKYEQARQSLATAEELSPNHPKLGLLKNKLAQQQDR